ncbi:transglycosylase domain-containing protein [Pseudarthrobacter phenanthrenivorans]|jgi:membrane peptidoglycan carboxypeptidase|uniref:Glycosyl transferase n=1 Tax=Pseudarthrobacter phenanthrenivorans TaxID=361575 RepID=A0A0B4D0E5_PSEPS|nr:MULTISPECIES: transglycosylase domain-containing protein [Micrococcaceae]KIC66884.1 glycosyl transferase [Pseudarthrobacter phenanthrenivorans]MDJ0455595.1 transglycosylase domain-containing protein [Arthrobacter sp. NQ7]
MATRNNPLFDTATTLGKILLFLGVSAICGVLVAGLLVPAAAVSGSAASGSIDFFDSLPAELKVDPPSQTTRILAADGSEIASVYTENRTKVPLDQISPNMKNAIIAVEDSRFYEHGGVDTTGILRALVATARGNKQGASTITQQYVNNVLNANLAAAGEEDQIKLNGVNKGVGDKLREMKLSIALEKEFSKDQILEGYLNIVFFNRDAYGIEAASRYFFSTTAKDLTLPQAALLAGLVNSPSAFDPITNPEKSKQRRDLVLGLMKDQKKITPEEYEAAVATPVEPKVTQPKQGCAYAASAPYFCDYVLHLLENNPAYGADKEERQHVIYGGGLTITTTLDPKAQATAQEQADAAAGANPDKWGASMVSVQPGTGKIISMAQNTSFLAGAGGFNSQLNFNVDQLDKDGNDLNGVGGFQPGSTMKPFTFAEWLNEGKSMNTVVNAAQRVYPIGYPWKNTCGKVQGAYSTAQKNARLDAADDLQNAEPQWYKPLTVLEGLYNSINTVTFASAAQLDFCGIQKIADAVGLHSGLPSADEPNPKINMMTLGNLLGSTQTSPLTMASAFATFANDGKYCEPIAITSVVDASGKQLPAQSSSCRDAIKPEVARGVNYALQEVLNRGSGSLIQPRISTKTSFPIGAKTGTSNNNGSTWVVGHTTGLATAAWFGDPLGNQGRAGQNITVNGKFYQGIDGYMIAGPMFSNYMAKVAPGYGANPFPAPPSNMVNGTTRTTTPATTAPQATQAPAPQVTQAPATQAPAPAPTSNGNGNNGKGNG